MAPPSPALWLQADLLNLTNGSKVQSWSDVSGSGATATQSNPSLQPVYLSTGLYGRPTVAFNGISTFLQNTALSLPAYKSIFAVIKEDGEFTTCCSGIIVRGLV